MKFWNISLWNWENILTVFNVSFSKYIDSRFLKSVLLHHCYCSCWNNARKHFLIEFIPFLQLTFQFRHWSRDQMADIDDTKPIESVKAALSLFEQKNDQQNCCLNRNAVSPYNHNSSILNTQKSWYSINYFYHFMMNRKIRRN